MVRTGSIEQHYLPGTPFPEEMLNENQGVIVACPPCAPCAVLSVFHVAMEVLPMHMNRDHFREYRTTSNILALAVVTDGEAMYTAAKLYFMYHLQPFETMVFKQERDARAWLLERMNAQGIDHTAQHEPRLKR